MWRGERVRIERRRMKITKTMGFLFV